MLLAIDAEPEAVLPLVDTAWATFIPRENNPAAFDEQEAYVSAKDLVSFALGGNASGKTAGSAKKCADFVLNKEPPRKNTPFWIISRTYDQAMGVCWEEKLNGQQFIPHGEVDWRNVRWYDTKRRWPYSAPLLPWPNGNNWMLEFKSYEQGWEALQAFSIGGFWFSEQFPQSRFVEVLRGCRDYLYPGGQFAEFTPADPELCIMMEHLLDNPPKGWGFYRLNTEKNRCNLATDWYDAFFAAVPDEMMATRQTGALATFEGVIYQTFNPAIHVIDGDSAVWRSGMQHFRATDWGASADHPFATVWGCVDGMGEWLVYDEYWSTSQDAITQDHATEVLARSIAWGWPEPDWFKEPGPRRSYYVKRIRERVQELRPDRFDAKQSHKRFEGEIEGSTYGENFADPSRPGEIQAFNHWGIPTSPASNDVYKGIDLVRARLKINPITNRPRMYFHKRCKHVQEEHRKYRWVKTRPGGLWTTAAPRPVPLKKDDDTCDAVRYLCASVERGRGQSPTSTDSRTGEQRPELLLKRASNGHAMKPMQAATQGFFRK